VSILKLGTAGRVVRAAALIACLLGLSAGLTAAPILVGITANSQIVQIDPLTGVGTAAATLNGDYNPLGIAWNGSSLYVYGQNAGDLRQVTNLATGATSLVATPLASLPATGGFIPTKGDLTYYGGNFYIGSTALADGSFDPSFGSFFSVADAPGYAAAQVDSGAFPKVGGLAFNGAGVLYGLDQFGNTLYTISSSTGNVTSSVSLTGPGLNPNDTVGGLIFGSDGVLYAAISANGVSSEWFAINPGTGAVTDIGSIGNYDIVGLALLGAPPTPIPEPGSFALIGTGAFAFFVLRRRRVNR
jgi:hypothetical protein